MERHRASPACAGCHKVMDPLGLALENFDAVGRWRTADAGVTIDASGELGNGTRVNGASPSATRSSDSRRFWSAR